MRGAQLPSSSLDARPFDPRGLQAVGFWDEPLLDLAGYAEVAEAAAARLGPDANLQRSTPAIQLKSAPGCGGHSCAAAIAKLQLEGGAWAQAICVGMQACLQHLLFLL